MEMPRSNSTGVESDKSLYQEGEKVWAFYRGTWYQAKVQKVESRMKAWAYFVHYLGWNKRWDEWLGTEHLMKFTEEDVQNQLMNCGKSAMVMNTESGHKRKEKQSAEFLLTEDNTDIEIPQTLKKQLLHDCEFVTHLGKLVELPRAPNVDDILNQYSAFRVEKEDQLREDIQEMQSGLRSYFDKALPSMLLYKTERRQYEALGAEHITPSVVYGAEHLLRLLVKLPEMLYAIKVEDETRMKIQREINGLLEFLQKNQSTFFLSTHQTSEDLDEKKE